MTNFSVLQPWLMVCKPKMLAIHVCHNLNYDIRDFRWTLPITIRVNPLYSFVLLNVSTESIHPAPSRAAALDQAILNCIFSAERLNICPTGITERDMSYDLVERLRLFDGACKARFAIRGRTQMLFIARAMKFLHGSFGFYWGKKPTRIFEKLPQFKHRISHCCARAHSFLCATLGGSFVQKTFAFEHATHC